MDMTFCLSNRAQHCCAIGHKDANWAHVGITERTGDAIGQQHISSDRGDIKMHESLDVLDTVAGVDSADDETTVPP